MLDATTRNSTADIWRYAWISIAAMGVIYLVMRGIRRHYDHVARELIPTEEKPVLPSRNRARPPASSWSSRPSPPKT